MGGFMKMKFLPFLPQKGESYSMINKLFLFSILFVITGCVSQSKMVREDSSLLAENRALKSKLAQSEERLSDLSKKYNKVRKELDEINNGPSRLLITVKNLINKDNGSKAKKTIIKLQENYPTSVEAHEATSLMAKAEMLISKEKKRKREEEERMALAKYIYTSVDKLEGITWYKAKLDQGEIYTRLITYFGKKKSNSPWLRMKLRYWGEDWLFIKSYFIVVDGKRYTFKKVNFKRDNSSSSIWEWNDRRVNKNDLVMLKHIAKSKNAVVRFQGQKYHSDHTISSDEKKAIQHVLNAFQQVKNTSINKGSNNESKRSAK